MSKTLALKFGLESGDTRTISLNHPIDDLTSSVVTNAMNQIIDATDVFVDNPIKILKATLTEKETTVIVNNEYN